MSEALARIEDPDFTDGTPLSRLRDGDMLKGRVHGERAEVEFERCIARRNGRRPDEASASEEI